MPKKLALCLLAALLAGCAGAPGAAQTAGTAAASPAPAVSPAPAAPLRALSAADDAHYYQLQAVGEDLARLWVTDFAARQTTLPCTAEGCEHNTPACPATVPMPYVGQVLVLDENTLIYPGGDQIAVSGADGGNYRTLAMANTARQAIFTDGTFLYYLDQSDATPGGRTLLCRLDPGSGDRTVLESFPAGTTPLGAAGRTLALCNYDCAPLPGTAGADGGGAARYDAAYNIDTGEARLLGTLPVPGADAHNDGQTAAVAGGVYYTFDFAARTVTGLAVESGETVLHSDPLPADVFAGRGYESCAPARVLGGWLELDYGSVDWTDQSTAYFSYLVNLQTGEVRRKPDLPALVTNGAQQPQVLAQLADGRLLVTCRSEPWDLPAAGTDGTPYTLHSVRIYLGLMTEQDYLNGTPAYTEVGELH